MNFLIFSASFLICGESRHLEKPSGQVWHANFLSAKKLARTVYKQPLAAAPNKDEIKSILKFIKIYSKISEQKVFFMRRKTMLGPQNSFAFFSFLPLLPYFCWIRIPWEICNIRNEATFWITLREKLGQTNNNDLCRKNVIFDPPNVEDCLPKIWEK